MGQLYAITPFSLLDYPGEMSCIAWFAGCNMRCVFCHNPDIVTGKGTLDDGELIEFLKNRTGRLGGVVFSGGEPTLYPELPDLMRKVKEMGFKIKLDTNGSRPEVLRRLLDEKLLDYVAMDYKCPPDKAESLIGTAKLWAPFRESLAMMIAASQKTVTPAKAGVQGHVEQTSTLVPLDARLRGHDTGESGGDISFEIRTTFHSDLMTDEDLNFMIEDLEKMGYTGTYYIQNIASTGDKTIGGIEKPERKIDLATICHPKGFKLAWRNF